jgi:hypothetical protein
MVDPSKPSSPQSHKIQDSHYKHLFKGAYDTVEKDKKKQEEEESKLPVIYHCIHDELQRQHPPVQLQYTDQSKDETSSDNNSNK